MKIEYFEFKNGRFEMHVIDGACSVRVTTDTGNRKVIEDSALPKYKQQAQNYYDTTLAIIPPISEVLK